MDRISIDSGEFREIFSKGKNRNKSKNGFLRDSEDFLCRIGLERLNVGVDRYG